jgi:hypothetical protein
MVFHITAMIAFPLIYAVYLGVAESARDIALELARKRRPDPHVTELVGKMETALRGAQLAHASMLAAVRGNKPGPETTNEIMIRRRSWSMTLPSLHPRCRQTALPQVA